ncbi:MAG: pyridoxamine 5'-phosphate oxidase family protein, partial [Tepidiformaceae bacterium]
MNWGDFELAAPELARFGRERLVGQVSYLATTRRDGSPRVHPVTPIIGDKRLFLFMDPSSPKGHDLQRDPRYALHCAVADTNAGAGEFLCCGTAFVVHDPELVVEATAASSYTPADRYILFELSVLEVVAYLK